MSTDRQSPPVMADVARAAGVSHQTVSRVINGSPNIRPSTRERVESVIRQLGYRPNTAARALVTRRSSTIGIISTGSGLYGPNSIHRTVEDAARGAGWFAGSVSLASVTESTLTDAIDHLLRQAVEGIVMIAGQVEALELVSRQDFGVPFVVVEGDLSKAPNVVGVDQRAGAYAATSHLVELGHTRIAHVRGPRSWTEADGRETGWREALADARLDPGTLLLGDWSARSGYAAGRTLVAAQETTAVFVANDQMAIGLLRAYQEGGRPAPQHVSVVGFDDTPEAEYLQPPLTTVRQDFAEVGRRAIAFLDAGIKGVEPPLERLVSPDVILRASTARPYRPEVSS
ncbi:MULTISPECIES: LacI family DNA-binding transcriptional regulator [unclassified Mumia]|uniref:LacI family DNA-binding transcriptional regulator n=1 Tax=unclassified Mumia TaxID=2621872 RepID=UPI00261DF707|nr:MULTISPECIES: LacI family DNA-binding transcriptional regulator [unclassified Mumia]MDD9347821.1 LacI family DNA-binding transcriptional regulator [Mumia sp.]